MSFKSKADNGELFMAWAAGFFDGEGYVTVGKRSPYKGKPSYYLRVGINHVNPEPLEELHEAFGGALEYQKPSSVKGNRKPRTRWVTNCETAAKVLETLLPYLHNKYAVALYGLELQKTMRFRGGSVPEEIHKKREELRETIIDWNSKD